MVEVLTEFPKLTDPRSGRPLLERTVLVANTSNMPVAAREVSIYTGVTIAEYYRDMGYHVALMADSTSRWAEALRELAARLEEMPAEEGFPAYLPTRLASFYERAGVVQTLSGQKGSVSIVGAVSPPGGDFSEPVTQHTKRFIRCYWALDTLLANARHYPSINWLKSYSEYIADVTPWWQKVDVDWAMLRQKALDILLKEEHLQQIVKLVGPDVLPDQERLVLWVAELIKNGFLQQNAFDPTDMYSSPAKQVGILRIMVDLHERGLAAINAGVPLTMLRELPCAQEVVRAKYTIPNDDVAGLGTLQRKMENDVEELRRRYAK
jgi:V/A-type H+-transporting ATPase subunit A